MNDNYAAQLQDDFSKKTIKLAKVICETTAHAYPEDYHNVENFKAHAWAVAAVCEALESKKFWKRMVDES